MNSGSWVLGSGSPVLVSRYDLLFILLSFVFSFTRYQAPGTEQRAFLPLVEYRFNYMACHLRVLFQTAG